MPLTPVGGASADALLGLGARSGLGLASGAAADHRGCPPLGSCLRPRWRGIAVPPRPFRAALLDSGAGVDTMLRSILLPKPERSQRPVQASSWHRVCWGAKTDGFAPRESHH